MKFMPRKQVIPSKSRQVNSPKRKISVKVKSPKRKIPKSPLKNLKSNMSHIKYNTTIENALNLLYSLNVIVDVTYSTHYKAIGVTLTEKTTQIND